MKRICRYLPLLAIPFVCASFASAQSQVDFGIGFGSNHAKSSGQSIDTFGNGTLYKAPALGGFFLGVAGDVMLYPHFGVGASASIQPNKPDYAGIQARTSFYDFRGIYAPVNTKKASLQLLGGLGAANMRFSYKSQYCNAFSGCSSQSQALDSSNHFALNAGAAVQLYLTDHIFVRPQFDVHYVHNFFQFGSNWVPGGTIWLGYSLGDR